MTGYTGLTNFFTYTPVTFGASRVKRLLPTRTVVATTLPKIRACAGMTALIIKIRVHNARLCSTP